MARLEDDISNHPSEVEKLQSEVETLKKSLKRKQNKKILTCGTCLLFFILIVFGLGSFGAYALARSGLVNVPFFSQQFYQEPQPSYLVKVENLSNENDLGSIFNSQIKEKLLHLKQTNNSKITLNLNEEQLTSLLRSQTTNGFFENKVDCIQLAVLPNDLELFMKMKNPVLFITLDFKPSIVSNKLSLKTDELKIGNLKLPKSVGNFILTYTLTKGVNQILGSVSGSFVITGLNLASRNMSIDILLKNFKA